MNIFIVVLLFVWAISVIIVLFLFWYRKYSMSRKFSKRDLYQSIMPSVSIESNKRDYFSGEIVTMTVKATANRGLIGIWCFHQDWPLDQTLDHWISLSGEKSTFEVISFVPKKLDYYRIYAKSYTQNFILDKNVKQVSSPALLEFQVGNN